MKTLKQLLKEKGSEDVQIDFYIDQIAEIVKEWLTQKRRSLTNENITDRPVYYVAKSELIDELLEELNQC